MNSGQATDSTRGGRWKDGKKINYLCYLNWHMNFHLLFGNAHRASAYTLTCAQFTSLRLRSFECVWMCERDLLLNHFTPRNQKIYQMHTNECKWKRNEVSADFLPLFPVLFRFWIFHVFYYRHATHTHTERQLWVSIEQMNEQHLGLGTHNALIQLKDYYTRVYFQFIIFLRNSCHFFNFIFRQIFNHV